MKTENIIPIRGVRKSYFKNGLQNGPYQAYFVSGERRISANYRNGKLNGLYERWDINGNLIACKTYSNGKLLATRNG